MAYLIQKWYYSIMSEKISVPAFGLYGEGQLFPDILHVERIYDRAEGFSWKISPHRHPHLHQFLLIRSGEAEAMIDAQRTKVAAGQAVNLPPWSVHGFHFEPHTEGLVISMSVADFPMLFEEGQIAQRLKHWQNVPISEELRMSADALYHCYSTTQFARREFLETHGKLVGLHFADAASGPVTYATLSRADSLVVRFEALVRLRFRERLKLSAYADELAVSLSHLSRSCRVVTGASASRFIESVVFHEACNQLAYSQLPVAQIGYDLGFQDAAYFSRAFRKHTGMSPGDYRNAVLDT